MGHSQGRKRAVNVLILSLCVLLPQQDEGVPRANIARLEKALEQTSDDRERERLQASIDHLKRRLEEGGRSSRSPWRVVMTRATKSPLKP
jgi:hypothetical protein